MTSNAEFVACIGKFQYLSRGDANKEIKRKKKQMPDLQAYRCEFCKNFHVGRLHKRIKP